MSLEKSIAWTLIRFIKIRYVGKGDAHADVSVSGEVNSFDHAADSGTVLTKEFCSKCGSQMFGKSDARELHNP